MERTPDPTASSPTALARLAFLGTPAVAAGTLQALVEEGHDVPLVITGPDRRRSRRGEATPTPVKACAVSLGLPVSEQAADVVEANVDFAVVVAFGKLIRPAVLERVPMLNIHFSLLPRWRGAAPVERAILAGDEETGVSIMALKETLDTGPVFVTERVTIDADESAEHLRDRLGALGTAALLRLIAQGPPNIRQAEPQVGTSTYAAKITAEDLALDFEEAAVICRRRVRIGHAFTTFRGKRLIVTGAQSEDGEADGLPGAVVGERVATTDGWFLPLLVRPEGRGEQRFADWLRGARLQDGERLGALN